jgi:hypothetical protein
LLRDFASRKGLTYPVLADPDSRVIRAFGIFNENFPPDHPWYGVPFPGTYIVGEHGIVRAKYFEEDHGERYTAANILVRQFNDGRGLSWTETETKHLKLRWAASDSVARPGNRILLLLEVELKRGLHVYAPGVQGSYIPIDWKVAESDGWLPQAVTYPAAENLHFAVLGETLPVYDGRLRLTRDITIGQRRQVTPLLKPGEELWIEGSFRYQACDDRQCFPPQTVPLRWMLHAEGHDSQRAPEELRRAP